MKDKNLVERAKEFATIVHRGQKRKFHGESYILHPEMVAFITELLGLDSEAIAASWLHDVVEDCGVELSRIERLFGENVADYVKVLTRDKSEDKEEYVKRFVDCNREIALIKLADIYHNTTDINCYPAGKQKRKREMCERYYLPRAKKDCPLLYKLIKSNLQRNSEN